jgi:hypothetical protein
MHARVNRCPHPSDAKGWPWPMNVSPVSNAASWPGWWPEDERLRGTMAASHAALVQAMAAAGLRQRPRLHLAQGPGGEGLAPSGPPIAQRRSALHAHVPSPTRSAGGARRVVAAWGLRVPRWPPLEVIWPSQATHVRTDARRTRVCSSAQSRHHGQMGWYQTPRPLI